MNETPSIDLGRGIAMRATTTPGAVFLIAGLLFLFAALALLLIAAYALYSIGNKGLMIGGDSQVVIGHLLSVFLAPLMILLSGIVCTFVGIRLLKAAGIVTQRVIPEHDYDLLSSAIREGNEKAVSEYIRLSSLAGMTGTFTRVGLTGLPLATILLTILLAILGVFEQKFFDLAQLTLGAFIGSYVQKRQGPPVS
jgi:hypothetical protein